MLIGQWRMCQQADVPTVQRVPRSAQTEENVKAFEADAAAAAQHMSRVQAVAGDVQRHQRLQGELPALRQRIAAAETEAEALQAQVLCPAGRTPCERM
jgi:hypothetical protein